MEERKVDVAIIGSGTAGLNALSQVRKAGKSFVLINGGEPGTTCARVGCMPSKAMIQIAEDYHRRTHLGKYGVDGHQEMTLDVTEAMEHVQDLRDTFVDRVLGNSTDDMPPDLFIQDYARFLEPSLIEVAGQRIRADGVVIATGSRPMVPKGWEKLGERILTTDSLFELEDLPGSVAVIGLGTIGLELGQSLARLGVAVTGFDQLETIGGITDPEVSRCAQELLLPTEVVQQDAGRWTTAQPPPATGTPDLGRTGLPTCYAVPDYRVWFSYRPRANAGSRHVLVPA